MGDSIRKASTADLIYTLGVHAARVEMYAHAICEKPTAAEQDQASVAAEELNRRLPGARKTWRV